MDRKEPYENDPAEALTSYLEKESVRFYSGRANGLKSVLVRILLLTWFVGLIFLISYYFKHPLTDHMFNLASAWSGPVIIAGVSTIIGICLFFIVSKAAQDMEKARRFLAKYDSSKKE